MYCGACTCGAECKACTCCSTGSTCVCDKPSPCELPQIENETAIPYAPLAQDPMVMQAHGIDIGAIKLSEQQTQFIEIMKVSKGVHPAYGELEITEKHLLMFKENFDRNARGIDLAIDFAHENDKQAAAWIKSLWLSEDKKSLWAEVRWTTEGAKAVLDRLYRYFSPEFTFNYIDAQGKSWGPVLLGGGLTNRPFLKDLTPLVQLNEKKKKDKTMDVIKLQEEVITLKSENSAVALKLSTAEKEVLALSEKVSTLETENKTLKDLIGVAEKKAEFDKALSEGKFIEAQREIMLSLPIETIKKLAEVAQPVLNLEAKGNSNEPTAPKLSEDELKLAKKLGVSAEEYLKYNA